MDPWRFVARGRRDRAVARGAIRAMQSLAAAADAAHRAGVALSIDHPSRVRVSIEGDVVLAYPATMPEANPQDDIRGIGAALYALLVNQWPLPESGTRSGFPRPNGMRPASPSNRPLSTATFPSRSPPLPYGQSRRMAEYAVPQRF
ncbi:hypothetical protein NIIDMKKI_76870 [Mycobacterium kansasii]|uniref:Uncharacterized protein n=1 Tax=Mycobacterium kansasii TaxID=1768 RepID=A0A7G1INC9_MYCKA|nr:hypothetical protein NIIDMKKI_76870 [Mycobacterium kansasii]